MFCIFGDIMDILIFFFIVREVFVIYDILLYENVKKKVFFFILKEVYYLL